ncbi:MAG: hypothetical protein ACWGOV_11245 [Acidiferrobacterales bacterium]
MFSRLIVAGVVGSLLFFSVGASAATLNYRVHYSLVNAKKPRLPHRLVILPVNIVVKEKTFGGVEEKVDKWSNKASKNIFRALANYAKENKSISLLGIPKLSSREDAIVTEHLALYKKVVNTAAWATRIQPIWTQKLRRFDYTIGPGLSFLRQKTGADTALLVYGEDQVSTGGRKAAATMAAIFGGSTDFGHSFIHLGLVDLRTGALLWTNSAYKGATGDLRRAEDAEKMVEAIFKAYPGIDKYRRTYVN